MIPLISQHQAFFAAYSQRFCRMAEDASMLHLKIVHTEHVLQNMQSLLQEETCLEPHVRACLLAALYHDIGRFEQLLQYKTFKDAQSVNHAHLGVKVLKQEGVLKNESSVVQQQVLAAVGMHNRFALPDGISEDIRRITLAVRDADKLDILRVMAEQFSPARPQEEKHGAVTFYAKDEPLMWSQVMVDDVLQNRLASYDNIVYINDFKLLFGTWIHDIHYTSSKKIMLKAGHLESILHTLPALPALEKAKEHILTLLRAAV